MSDFELKFTGDAEAFFKNAPGAVAEAVAGSSVVAAKELLEGVQKTVPVRSGDLRESFELSRQGATGSVVASDLIYAPLIQRRYNYLERGFSYAEEAMALRVAESLGTALGKAAK